MNPAGPVVTSAPTQPCEIAPRHNRKRTRHRPHRCRKPAGTTGAVQPSRSYAAVLPNAASTTGTNAAVLKRPRVLRQESATSRDRRMFGGLDDDTESALELRGPMLDVVLGLFNGIDYDDGLV